MNVEFLPSPSAGPFTLPCVRPAPRFITLRRPTEWVGPTFLERSRSAHKLDRRESRSASSKIRRLSTRKLRNISVLRCLYYSRSHNLGLVHRTRAQPSRILD